MAQFLRHYLLALQFFTRIPLGAGLARWVGFSPALLRASAAHFPGIGWLVGALAVACGAGLLRALPVQALFTVRSERQLMQQITYNMLFRWFVGLSMDDPVWDVTEFTKNRDRLLEGDIARGFLAAILGALAFPNRRSEEMFDEVYVRQNTGLGMAKAIEH